MNLLKLSTKIMLFVIATAFFSGCATGPFKKTDTSESASTSESTPTSTPASERTQNVEEEEPALPPPPANFNELTRIIGHPSDDQYPEVSPTGKLVAYSSKKGKTFDIFYFNPKDKRINVTQVTRHVADDYDPAWSADSKYIYFTSSRLKTLSIWKTKVKGGRGLNQISLRENVNDFNPSISGKKKKMVFTSLAQSRSRFGRSSGSSAPTLWISNVDGSRVVQIGSGHNPRWSPDGKTILFHAKTGDNYDIWMIQADGTNLTQITTDSADDVDASWSPKGTKIVFSSKRQGTYQTKDNFDIWALDMQGTGMSQLTFDPADDGGPFWAADGAIYFHSNRGNDNKTYDIYVGKPIIDWN